MRSIIVATLYGIEDWHKAAIMLRIHSDFCNLVLHQFFWQSEGRCGHSFKRKTRMPILAGMRER